MNNILERLREANRPAHLGGAVVIESDLIAAAAAEIERLEAECGMFAAGLCIHPEALNAVDDHDFVFCEMKVERDEWKRRAEQIWQDLDRTITGEWPANASARTWFPEAAEWFEEP